MNSFIKYHLNKYKEMSTQDIVKLLYQNHFGPGHFIENKNSVINYYTNELKASNINSNENLYEHIGNNFIRLNIFPYNNMFNNDNIINFFYESSLFDFNNNELKLSFINNLKNIPNDGFLDSYQYANVHHTIKYNQLYMPHYRVINTKFLTLEMKTKQLQNYIDSHKEFTIFALEGKCASGKTTIANNLINVSIIDVDDFFLKQDKKTPSRLNEVGGNIDYDLYLECIKKIKPNQTITYTIFDCMSQTYKEKTIEIKNNVLLTGVYSYHPLVRKYIDKLCLLLVSDEDQLKILRQRTLFDRFINEWVPLENKYYNSYDFIGNADILI